MSRLKTAVARRTRIEFKRECRRNNHGLMALADHFRRCVSSHSSKGNRLRLKVDDDGRVLECICCELPLVQASDGVMEAVVGELRVCGIEFDVLCEKEMVG
jgi:hypothetical protein